MSIVDPIRRGPQRGQGGFTMVEMIISVAILATFTLVAERSLSAVRETNDALAASRRVQRRTEKLAYRVRSLVSSSRKLFYRGSIGDSYLQALDVTELPPAAAGRLPLPDESRDLKRDQKGVPRTGNILLFARESDPYVCSADVTSGKVRYIDVYRFVCIYAREFADRRVVHQDPEPPRDLVIWTSVGYPSLSQIVSIQDAGERERVVRELRDRYGYTHAWNPDALATEGFFTLLGTGDIAGTPDAGIDIGFDPDLSPGGRLIYANLQLARSDQEVRDLRAVMTRKEVGGWRPDGFEVKIAGDSGRRKIWIRLVAQAQSTRGAVHNHGVTFLASVRDF